MPWYEIPRVLCQYSKLDMVKALMESIWRQLEAVAQPTNPSSFTLAFVGVGTFLCYQILARPGHGRRWLIDLDQPAAKPQATAATTEDRRVA